MEIESFNELAIYLFKTITLVAMIYLIFSFGMFIDKKITELLPRLPKFALYILIVVFGSMYLLFKLLGFGIIKA